MAVFPAPLPTSAFAANPAPGSPLAWATRGLREGPGEGEAWVVHATPEWSRERLEDPPADSARALVDALLADLAVPPSEPLVVQGHRWRFSQLADAPVGEPCAFSADTGLGLCGDWFLGARLEDAYASGAAMADSLAASL